MTTTHTIIDQKHLSPGNSFIELRARDRAFSLLDQNRGVELLGPFDRLESRWLEDQGIVAQADDGCVIVLGAVGGKSALIIAIEGAFQGGSIGETSGMKIAHALKLAHMDCEAGTETAAILLLESGGVRLQEANLGLAAIAEIHDAIVTLKQHVPVVAVIAGMTGCFGGMSIAAGLCTHLIMTRQGRLGLNGPEVIEQEAGIQEIDSRNRQIVWRIFGGSQRYEMGFIDTLVDDDIRQINQSIRHILSRPYTAKPLSLCLERYQKRLSRINVPARFDYLPSASE